MKRKNCLEIVELPLRAKSLETSELSNIFGGCNNFGDKCMEIKYECCPGLWCYGDGGTYCRKGL